MIGASLLEQEGQEMFARVSTFQGSPERLDESTQNALDHVLPAARQVDGFVGLISLVDRSSGRSIAITLWRDADAMRASEGWADRVREASADEAGESIVSVERYEVAIAEVPASLT